jgi:hypothetical protein
VKDKAKANKSLVIQYFKANAIVSETVTAVCADGIHQLQRAILKSNFHFVTIEKIPFINTLKTNAMNGINNICS